MPQLVRQGRQYCHLHVRIYVRVPSFVVTYLAMCAICVKLLFLQNVKLQDGKIADN